MTPDLLTALANVTGQTVAQIHAHPQVWDERIEARMVQIAESYDDETGRYRRLGAGWAL